MQGCPQLLTGLAHFHIYYQIQERCLNGPYFDVHHASKRAKMPKYAASEHPGYMLRYMIIL